MYCEVDIDICFKIRLLSIVFLYYFLYIILVFSAIQDSIKLQLRTSFPCMFCALVQKLFILSKNCSFFLQKDQSQVKNRFFDNFCSATRSNYQKLLENVFKTIQMLFVRIWIHWKVFILWEQWIFLLQK